MKKLALFVFIFTSLISAQNNPVAGKKYLLEYTPKGSLINSSELKIVYAFDYWSIYGLPEQGHTALFNNVLHPDSGRKNESVMFRKKNKWYAELEIPKDANLLSYYITDGTNNDYNEEKTYVKYICDSKGKPVQGARFRNIDFLLLAGHPKEDIIREIAAEIKDYPNNLLAYVVYWRYKVESVKDMAGLAKLKAEFDKQFAGLKAKQKNDTDLLDVIGYELRISDEFMGRINRTFAEDRDKLQKQIVKLSEAVPEEKRSPTIKRELQRYKATVQAEQFAETIMGKTAPDFEFTDLNGSNIKLSSFKGQYVLLDFWGTWCGPCVAEIPNLVKAFNLFKEKGFHIVSISSDALVKSKTMDELKTFVSEKGMSWTHCYDSEKIIDLYKINHFPTLYLLDKNGVVIKNERQLRGESLEETLNGLMNQL